MSPPHPEAPLATGEAERIVARAVDDGQLERAPAERLAAHLRAPGVLEPLLEGASESRRRGKGDLVSFSRNIFIPLTNLCRDRCGYCTFAVQPDSLEAKTYTLSEVREAVAGGKRAGCVEALMCLGDKPEMAYRSHRQWLAERGLSRTAEYLVQACRVAFESGMLPHTNAGILSVEEMVELRPWNASMGLMLAQRILMDSGRLVLGVFMLFLVRGFWGARGRFSVSRGNPCVRWSFAVKPESSAPLQLLTQVTRGP